MSQIVNNGRSYVGNNVIINNGKIIIGGKDYTPDGKEINIQVDGSIEQLHVDVCLKCVVNGDAGHVETGSGDVEITGNITGNLQTGTGDVGGSIQTGSGGVKCNNVGGNVKTSTGSIKYRK